MNPGNERLSEQTIRVILGLYWGYIRVTLGSYWGYIGVIWGIMEKNMETAIIFLGCDTEAFNLLGSILGSLIYGSLKRLSALWSQVITLTKP